MDFARRAFLQFTAGVTGGILLTPLPWKLADDSAIWSQNWSWRPSPSKGQITRAPSICRLCDGGCGIQARLVEKNRAYLLEGNPDHPINRGGICALGAAGLQFLYAPYRIAQPQKQTKKRGDMSGFQAISWEEALGELAARLAKLRTEGKSSSVACISGSRRSSMDDLWRQFLTAYGSQNHFTMPSLDDSLSLASALATGRQAPIAFALEKASYILSFGSNLMEGSGTSARMQSAYGRRRQDSSAKLVQVESRCSMTAAKADRWVPIAPGAETALALAIAHVMIKDNLYDADFVHNHVFGFEDWTDSQGRSRKGFKNLVLAAYAPEQATQRTGIDSGRIRELAREFAAQKNAIAVWGDNRAETPNNIYHDMSFIALNALKGNLCSAGLISLVPTVPLGELPAVAADDVAQKSLARKRLDLAAPQSVPLPGNGLYGFLDAVSRGGSYPVDVLMVYEANPAHSLPENGTFQAALAKTGYLVSFTSYMDETAMQADLILPNHTAFERFDDVIGLSGAPYGYYAVSSPIVPPRLQTRHTGDVILQLSKQLGKGVADFIPWESYEAYLKERVNGLASSGRGAVADKAVDLWNLRPGEAVKANYSDGSDLWTKLTKGQCWYDAPVDPMQGVKTASGKIELACQLLQKNGLITDDDQVYLPHFAPLNPSGSESEFPLQLVTYQKASLTNSYLANPPFMTKTLPDCLLKGEDQCVELHPQTARSLGFREGDRVMLKTPQGEVPVRVHLFAGARPGIIYMAQGLGHEAYDQYIQGKGVNVNSVIEVQVDPITGLGAVWATRAQLRRA